MKTIVFFLLSISINSFSQPFRDNFLGTYTGKVESFDIGYWTGSDRLYVDISPSDTNSILITDSIPWWLNIDYILYADSTFANYWEPTMQYGYFYSNGDSIFVHEVHNNPYFREWHCGRLGAGVNEVSREPFSIFPNPCSEKIFINAKQRIENYSLSIYNSLGQSVFEKSISCSQTITEIDLPLLYDGIYFLKIKSQNNFFTQKIVIQN